LIFNATLELYINFVSKTFLFQNSFIYINCH